ncbi:uncharacterized protein LOC100879070 [Megachile rotundata]|uniref:uncharacterized protein LOC100879070 n=1 Tax=Megachile rotundata TaxID=143995 RepID=UPI000614E5CC|nr:PREDICTED: uncharacterized protein LOC100879070 [Megachile rotundata]XP_012140138.1 PREDICTED: uncharacterized protein LOC100879070 [Megachile rotundata]XP_012140139.1 PREDICTED: uncharacterized protein LOC100879070 [Megachile rotundata]XP_012140140.1 PREDICTED: uncharacterized protein LOC100879070 [Megachile rotundata]XP_012140141.1 PREDICTED: uncharacterized protein LOC100879070 [Megachile rotundata]XP_012140142.1 PREDICTED: uncharacterized protein LOC100879070 [Megachile rotundata]XP_01
MIVQRCLLAAPICLLLSINFVRIEAERWSRQVSNSEWIPLANPRATQTQIEQSSPPALLASGSAQVPQLPQLSLPPPLQQQYQEQLLQLQKTQESIQKLLLLQQQLKAQQQLLQSQTFLPSGFSSTEEDKQLHHSGLTNSPTLPDAASEDLVPPLPASEALPPVFPAQNFYQQRPRPPALPKQDLPQEFASLSGQEFKGQLLPQGQNLGNIGQIDESQRQGAKHLTESLPPAQDEEEEVQLVYVPAETLAQRGQPKRGRGRKQFPHRQQHQQHHQNRDNQGVDTSAIVPDQDAYTRQLLQQLQMEREEKERFLKEERMKEIARLNEEQRELERKARLQQEALQREQEQQRLREAEKKRKELEEIEKQRELERIREAREKQRLEELEQRRLAEIRAKEEKRRAEEAARRREAEEAARQREAEEAARQREAERLAALERQKEQELQRALKQQQILEKQREDEARLSRTRLENQDGVAQALPLIKDQQQQLHRQHLTETSKPAKSKIRGRPRQRPHHHDQQNYRETTTTTTPSPNQPPLSVYMGSSSSKTANVKVSDVLKLLKDAKTIAVLDTVGPDTPQVFVGPTNLDPPSGYAKFDLPYLSSIDHNRVERKVDKLPFFVAPLSFDPPPGYSKIPFPAPHIGSVVVNTLDNTDPKDSDNPNPSPTPLIEPNSYLDGLNSGSDSSTPLYEPQTTIGYSQDQASTPKYEQTYSSAPPTGYSGSRFRFRQYYGDSKPASVITTSYYDDQRPTTRKHKYFDDNLRTTENPLQNTRVETSVSQREEVSYSTTQRIKDESIITEDPATKAQDVAAQLALINQELAQQREAQRYNTAGQFNQYNTQSTTGLSHSFDGEIASGDINDVRSPVGPTQYSLPAELPAISPHLPGLVNSLLDKNEAKLQTTSTTTSTTTTTTTTQRTPTTTYRPRSRQRNRVVSTRPRTTTQTPSTRTNADRSRRPYNRSRSRFTTTTEDYRESAYEATKSRIPETTARYNAEQRRPSSRTQKHRSRDKASQQAEVFQSQNIQQPYENVPNDAVSPTPSSAFLQPTGPDSSLRQLDASPNPPENYPPSTISTTENYPSLPASHGSPLISEDYSRSQNYPQNLPQDSRYRGGYDQSGLEQGGLENAPVNGFNYQTQNRDTYEQGILQRPKDYQLDGKAENTDFELATTANPRLSAQEEQRYSSVYEVNVPQTQPEFGLTGQNLHRLETEKIQPGAADPNDPVFVLLPENKQEDYELSVSSTETPISDITTETTTTSTTPVIIRQRVRGRVGSRVHHEPSVQTRNRGSQDEYVRFNVVNQESTRTSPRQRSRTRSRNQNHGSQVQTDGNEYIKIHVAQQKQVATTTPQPTTTTTTTTTTERPPEEDVDYGFIRPPNFRPVHPVDNRFPAPVTFRPQLSEHLLQVPQQSLLPNDETAVESSPPQTQLLKTRQKYQQAPNRRLPIKATTLPPATTTEAITTTERIPVATVLPDDSIYTVKPKSRTDEPKQGRVRSRVRRPGRKRVSTSTTESVREAHNELPLDENYPRIRPQSTTTEQPQQANLYDDNYDGAQYSSSRNQDNQQFYETSSENYPAEFILNFGNYPSQHRDEYDQTQLASDVPRKYSQETGAKAISEDSRSTTADIYGSESQWSTKLTRTSFQPSFAVNRVAGEAKKDREWLHESSKDVPDIITAAPEPSSVTLLVSSEDKTSEEAQDEESMLMGTTIFGRKTNTQDHTERMNVNDTTTDAPIMRDINGSEAETNREPQEPWLIDKVESSTEKRGDIDFEKSLKKSGETGVIKKGTRRRRVRVRVRPAVDDFVTAESQHFNSAFNGLFRDQYKYNPIRESKLPTSSNSPDKFDVQDFEILKSNEPKPTTTEVPEEAWTMAPAVTTPMSIPDDEETTTEDQVTTLPTTEVPEETTESSYEDFVSRLSETNETKKTKKDNWREKSVRVTLNLGSIADAIKENDVDKLSDESNELKGEDISFSGTRSKNNFENEEKDVSSEESKDGDDYPKNHRAKWSEVRYPSSYDHPQASGWSYEPKSNSKPPSPIPGLVTKEGDSSVKTLSDYVQAIFDTMKSAEEETTTANTEESTTLQIPLDDEFQERTTTMDVEDKTTRISVDEEAQTKSDETDSKEMTTESSTNADLENVTTLEKLATTPQSVSSSSESSTTDPTPARTTTSPSNATESILGKILRTSTTTKVSHMTEICYRGRCVMTRPSREVRLR